MADQVNDLRLGQEFLEETDAFIADTAIFWGDIKTNRLLGRGAEN